MCTQYGGKFKNKEARELDTEQWVAFLEDIAWARPRIGILGGEPTIYPGFTEVVDRLMKLDIPFDLVTNGYYLEEHVDRLASADARIVVSVDGPASVHNRIRNSADSFQRIESALRRLTPYRREFGRPYLAMNCVLLPENVDQIDSFLGFALACEPNLVMLQHPQYATRGLNGLTDANWRRHLGAAYPTKLLPKVKFNFNEDYLRKLTRIVAAIRDSPEYGSHVVFFPDFDDDELRLYYSDADHFLLGEYHSCTKPWSRPTVDPDGKVSICLDYFIGNVAVDDFWTIWDGAAARSFRRSLTRLTRFPVCTRCCNLYAVDQWIPSE